MTKLRVLIEASEPFAENASELLKAVHFEPVRHPASPHKIHKILHQIASSAYEVPETGSVVDVVQRIQMEAKDTLNRHHHERIVFCVPDMSDKEYVQVVAEFSRDSGFSEALDLTNNAPAAVARIIQSRRTDESPVSPRRFVLDAVSGADTPGDDLRDDVTGKLNAKKVKDLFGIKIPAIAEAAGISRQGLDDNPVSEKAQPVLKLFERIARLRAYPQFKEPSDLRKWFRRSLPLFSNRSAEDLFKAGKLEVVATKVDQLLTGDFGG